MNRSTASRHWDLWLLRALQPTAEAVDLQALLREKQGWRHRLCELPKRLLSGDRDLISAGREHLAGDPALRCGVLLTLHYGPYPCVLEPLLAAGVHVTVVASELCSARWRPLAIELGHRLGHSGRIDWLAPSAHCHALGSIGRRLRQTIKTGGTVVLFADGGGLDAMPLQAGGFFRAANMTGPPNVAGPSVSFRLPGRAIRVPIALARWLCRKELAVHPVAVRWCKDGRSIQWRRQATQRWSNRHDPRTVAQLLYEWVFHEIMDDPAQWSAWSMLVSGILAATGGPDHAARRDREAVPAGLQADYRRAFQHCLDRAATTVRVKLEADLAVWPDGILADLTHDRFYRAAGLREQDLALLRSGSLTLEKLSRSLGRAWVETHVQRLCLLGVARLQAVGPDRGVDRGAAS